MYAEWASLESVISSEQRNWSVLNKFPASSGKDVVIAVVKNLALDLGLSSSSPKQPSNLDSDKEVLWCLEVLCYGLSLPLSETEAIKDCVNVYCEWLTALTKPGLCVPKSIVEDPNNYGRRMINHLYNLFVPRFDSTPDQVQRQILYCHRVLRCLQKIVHESSVIAESTWETLLMFLLSVNDTLLASPPTKNDDLGDQLCERILGVLFEVWLLACRKCFPSPSLWKTFREMACRWRHRIVLIDQWNKVNVVLTARVLKFMFDSNFPELKSGDEDGSIIPPEINNECLSQIWFRFLHLLGNPIDLCKPGIISQTPRFFHYALSSETVIDPWQHQCLLDLPHIFLKAMKGVAIQVNSFLAIQVSANHTEELLRGDKLPIPHISSNSTPPGQRRIMKSISTGSTVTKIPPKTVMSITSSKSSSSQGSPSISSQPNSTASTPSSNITNLTQHALSFSQEVVSYDTGRHNFPGRPRCNSVLHLFGAWLFEAALLGCKVPSHSKKTTRITNYGTGHKRQSSVFFDQKTSSVGMSSLPDSKSMPEGLSLENFESGQAEAIGALCKIICAKKTDEDILAVYLARFYLTIKLNLCDTERVRGQVISSILLNSQSLFRQDLDGVHTIYPAFVHALQMVFKEATPTFKLNSNIQPTELRRAGIHILLSLLCLPLHFKNLPIKDIVNLTNQHSSETFQALKSKLIGLLISALKEETDAINTQMLLGGLLTFVQDCAAAEDIDEGTAQNSNETIFDPAGNLSDTAENLSVNASNTSTDKDEHISFSSANSLQSMSHSPLHVDPESLEYPDFDMLSTSDSAHTIFMRATYLVCHKLISSWKTDLNISLAAIELLAGLAKIKVSSQESLECKRAVKWISDFIVYQCSRPPPAHSKDLHSTIVAAYHCLTIWLVEHPYLLRDKECLNVIVEVVELGISGSKSQPKPKDVPKMKAEKDNKPVSMRVRDAAESVLAYIMTQVGYFPCACGPESLSSLLHEGNLYKHCKNVSGDITNEEIGKNFKYFVIENSVILAILDQPFGKTEDPSPTIIVLMRGPFGRKAWTIEQRYLPLNKSGSKCLPVNPGRPFPLVDVGVKSTVNAQYFPDSVDRIPACRIDKSIPNLNDVIHENGNIEHENLSDLIEKQATFERNVNKKYDVETRNFPNLETECNSPALCNEFQTARLFLSQFGFSSLDSLKESLTHPVPSLVMLDQEQPIFYDALTNLDKISDRTYDTVFVFYMKSDQRKASEILANVSNISNVNPHFLEFLLSLGWPVDVAKHSGWTGNVATSWRVPDKGVQKATPLSNIRANHGGSLYDGQNQVLYWSDVSSEVAFVVPSLDANKRHSSTNINSSYFDTTQESEMPAIESREVVESTANTINAKIDNKSRTLLLDLDKSGVNKESEQNERSSGRKYGRQGSSAVVGDAKVLVVWLESFEDHAHFPTNELLQHMSVGNESGAITPRSLDKDLLIIFIHALKSGLYRIKMQGSIGKMTLAIPLVDGMVVSRRILATLVRQTVLNMCRRKRLELDNYQPPHVRRKLMIQDIVQKYRTRLTEPEFYTKLFL